MGAQNVPLTPLTGFLSFDFDLSPSPIHLLHDLTIFPAWPRMFSCVSCESHFSTVIHPVLFIKDGIAKEQVDKIRLA
jgi:hypothetical protein